MWSGTKQNLQMHQDSQTWHLLAGYFTSFHFQHFSLAHVPAYHPKVSRGSSWGTPGVWVDIPGRAAPVSVSESVSTLSVAQSFATCSRKSLSHFWYRVQFSTDSKRIEKSTIYKPKCNFLWPLHCFSQERIIIQVLICPINTLHEHIILKNTNRFFFTSILSSKHCGISGSMTSVT